ncbi:MAG: prepilin-type N-terminal cleavage/methylation domain-containing protein [Phycisphaerae bacterium]|nr:type II secretion system protein [Phycisphaerae bacterium]NIR66778.1 type II secretion system protein [candidate division Zixibacteria bacterium]NIP52647.1 type II secretion system protein [Phycisphaerae bacterium]NIS49852.1 type II secretion system protein [Phycisphaerae bacterium]NIU07945.1 type II secretion system protein [Phycisphaerae bacterium]
MNFKLRRSRGFTLIELVVAIAIMVMMISFAAVIFKVSIKAHRTASANAEIMQKLRAITDQWDRDFKDLRKDAPFMIWFFQDATDPDQRYDQIMFFADGDFQSTQLYGNDGVSPFLVPFTTGVPIRGNIARIYYGQARVYAPMPASFIYPWFQKGQDSRDRVLSRRRHILTSDPRLDIWPDPANIAATFDTPAPTPFDIYRKNDFYEHDSLSLAHWKIVDRTAYDGPILNGCFDLRTIFDTRDPNTFQRLMCRGVSSLTIQWAYWDPAYNRFHWFPSNDPDGDGDPSDSHFQLMLINGYPASPDPGYANFNAFGTFFNIPTDQINYWGPIYDMMYNSGVNFSADFFPRAIKFTFTLHESKDIIKDGRVFTHIIYLGD